MGTGSQRLQRDHQGLTEKLATLQAEIGLYDDELHETDIHRVLETLEFINSYPQACHHPLEEAAMEYLRDQGVELPPEFDHIHQQHQQLEQFTAQLQQTFEAIFQDHVVPLHVIREQLRAYLDLQFEHMDLEDRELIPRLEQLSDEDWQQIRGRVTEKQEQRLHWQRVGEAKATGDK